MHTEIARLNDVDMFTGGEHWEVYTVLADSESFGTSPQHLGTAPDGQAVCCTTTPSAPKLASIHRSIARRCLQGTSDEPSLSVSMRSSAYA